jgi:hypothetical protein
MDIDNFRKRKNDRELSEHELDDDALEQLIKEKFKRARAWHLALNRQDDELIEQD